MTVVRIPLPASGRNNLEDRFFLKGKMQLPKFSLGQNWLTTAGGLIAALGLLPDAWGAEIQKGVIHTVMPAWFYLLCTFAGKIGPVVIGVGAADALRGAGKAAIDDSPK